MNLIYTLVPRYADSVFVLALPCSSQSDAESVKISLVILATAEHILFLIQYWNSNPYCQRFVRWDRKDMGCQERLWVKPWIRVMPTPNHQFDSSQRCCDETSATSLLLFQVTIRLLELRVRLVCHGPNYGGYISSLLAYSHVTRSVSWTARVATSIIANNCESVSK